jgi:hypothetical protein
MAVMLRRAGHEPSVFTLNHGRVSEVLRKGGVSVTSNLHKWSGSKFDVAHVHHNTCAGLVREAFPKLPMVFVSHGILPELEKPPPAKVGVSKHVAVSDEVRAMLHNMGRKSVVLRNAVDVGRFKPSSLPGDRPRRVLVISNHFPVGHLKLLKEACGKFGTELRIVGMGTENGQVWNTERLINEADVVVSLGRGCVEAMACGRAVLVWDVHGGDGYVTLGNYPQIRENNFSGRRHRRTYDLEDLVRILKSYDPAMGPANRRLALKYHDLERQMWEWEAVYDWAISGGVQC